MLSAPDSLAMRALADQGITAMAIRAAAESGLPQPAGESESPPLIPYDAPAKKVLELTAREALRLGHNYIGTEHLLLALLAVEAESPGPLHDLGADPRVTEDFLLAAIGKTRAS